MAERRRNDRGDASLEAVLVVPVLLFLLLVIVQAGLWYHANQVVDAAAEEAVQAGRLEGGTAAAAESRAGEFIARVSPRLADDATVRATRTDDATSVTVTATVQPVLPGARLTVTGTSSAPTERFREDR